jgi:hypothetical protein
MRMVLALALVLPLTAGCTPYLPEKLDFGTSGAAPQGTVPPEFAKFNNFDPNVGTLVGSQICATSYQPRAVTTSEATPGALVNATGTCATHMPIIGN